MLPAVLEVGHSLLQSPQFRALLAVWWLLPCAIQDRRSATVSPALTVPLFLAAWPVAWLTGGLWPRLALVAFVFVLAVVLFKPTDARMATGLAALCGVGGFVVYLVVQLAAFRLVHIANGKILGVIGGFVDNDEVHLPAGLWFYVAALVWYGLLFIPSQDGLAAAS